MNTPRTNNLLPLAASQDKHRLEHEPSWMAYRNNLPRHLIGISRHLQSQIMHKLTNDLGHDELKLSFEPFISLVGDEGCRISELANELRISKQACSQAANLLEKVGYIERADDPIDRRAKTIRLSNKGIKLRQDGLKAAQHLEKHYASLLGKEKYQEFSSNVTLLYAKLKLPLAKFNRLTDHNEAMLGGALPRISDYLMRTLMDLTIARGNPGLKMSHGQVLMFIGLEGGRIHQIAKIQEVSKQAISAIANDLEELGYVYRTPDPEDARQLLLNFSDSGWQLIKDSVDSVTMLEQQLQTLLGTRKLQRLKTLAESLYQGLSLEVDVFGETNNIEQLAQQLRKQLGNEKSKALGKLLLS